MKAIGASVPAALKVEPPSGGNGKGNGDDKTKRLVGYLADFFPEVDERGVKALLRAGLLLSGAYRVGALRHKIESDPTKAPKNAGAFWFTYLKSECPLIVSPGGEAHNEASA